MSVSERPMPPTNNSLQLVVHNSDVTREILDYFEPYYSYSDRQALVNVALSCRALSNLALDRLWERINSVYPLLFILPGMKEEGDELVRTL